MGNPKEKVQRTISASGELWSLQNVCMPKLNMRLMSILNLSFSGKDKGMQDCNKSVTTHVLDSESGFSI